MFPERLGRIIPKRARKRYHRPMLPQIKTCWIQVKWDMVNAIWTLTAHMMQVNIVVPTASMSAVWPPSLKACE